MSNLADAPLINKADQEAFMTFIVAFMATNYRHNLESDGALLWFGSFSGQCTLDQFMRAVTSYSMETNANGVRLPQPVPADILVRIHGNLMQAVWRKVMYAVHHFGAHYTMDFDDKKIHGAIEDMGGWARFCAGLDKKREQDLMQEFFSYYRVQDESRVAPLKGLFGNKSPVARLKSENGTLMIKQEAPGLLLANKGAANKEENALKARI